MVNDLRVKIKLSSNLSSLLKHSGWRHRY